MKNLIDVMDRAELIELMKKRIDQGTDGMIMIPRKILNDLPEDIYEKITEALRVHGCCGVWGDDG